MATRTEEEPEAVRGVARVEWHAMGGVVYPSPTLDRLVRGHVDQDHPQVGEEEEPYPNVVVSLSPRIPGRRKAACGYDRGGELYA